MTTLTLPDVRADERDTSASQWFTPPKLARRVASWACTNWLGDVDENVSTWTVLEPSAGDGALLRALEAYIPRHNMWAIDIDPRNVQALLGQSYQAECVDFLELEPAGHLDLMVMNPPYEKGQAEQHIVHALRFAPRVIAIVPLTTLEGSSRLETLWSRVNLERLAICSTRPKFGTRAGQTAIAVVDITRGKRSGNPHASACVSVEWWR